MKTLLLIFLFALAVAGVKAQTSIKAQAGLGYLEHFSAGVTLTLKEKNLFSILYGSNFFYKPQNFSTLYFQYDRIFPSLIFGKFVPGAGVKFGYSVYTDDYYTWKVISASPFFSLTRKINSAAEIGTEAGLAISRIESVTRISYGEIGKYKRYLPELKILMRYRILNLSSE